MAIVVLKLSAFIHGKKRILFALFIMRLGADE